MADTVNYARYGTNVTQQIFDRFYNYSANVSSQEWDVVFSYFQSVFKSENAASNFATTIFRIAAQTNTSPMALFQQLEGKSGPELTVTMAYYLNSNRSPCTLLGVSGPVVANYYVAHNIRP